MSWVVFDPEKNEFAGIYRDEKKAREVFSELKSNAVHRHICLLKIEEGEFPQQLLEELESCKRDELN